MHSSPELEDSGDGGDQASSFKDEGDFATGCTLRAHFTYCFPFKLPRYMNPQSAVATQR